jgi:hypothetical protein
MALPKRIMDVAHPGKSAPSTTSKSIIINSQPLPDPMLVPHAEATSSASAAPSFSGAPASARPEAPNPVVAVAPMIASTDVIAELPTATATVYAASDGYAEPAEAAAVAGDRQGTFEQSIGHPQYRLPPTSVKKHRTKRLVSIGIATAALAVLSLLAWALITGHSTLH